MVVSIRIAGLIVCAIAVFWVHSKSSKVISDAANLPHNLEPQPGTNQCNYELLRAFDGWMDDSGAGGERPLRYTLGAGTLLGAMRTQPTGLIQWEHDVDVYVPARDAHELAQRLERDCAGADFLSPWCRVLDFRGFKDKSGKVPCCGERPVVPTSMHRDDLTPIHSHRDRLS